MEKWEFKSKKERERGREKRGTDQPKKRKGRKKYNNKDRMYEIE
jgi:hypothetical protein